MKKKKKKEEEGERKKRKKEISPLPPAPCLFYVRPRKKT
jgi:hypothetical protein